MASNEPTKLVSVRWPNLDRRPGFRGVLVGEEWHVEEWQQDHWEGVAHNPSESLSALLQSTVEQTVEVDRG